MMKLLKYDWKRNANAIIATAAVLLLVEVLLTVVGKWKGWQLEAIYVFSILAYGGAFVMLWITACRTYGSNIKSYSRRLLARPSWHTTVSPLVLGAIGTIVLGLVIGIHTAIFISVMGIETELGHLFDNVWHTLTVLLWLLWSILFTAIIIFFCITFAATITGKGGTWLGIVAFIVIETIQTWLEGLLFGSSDHIFEWYLSNLTGEVGMTYEVNSSYPIAAGGTWLFEIAVALLLVYAINYLLNNKVKM